MVGGGVSDAVPLNSGAPRQIGTVVELARIKPDLHPGGVDLVPYVADVVRDDVESRGRVLGLDVCPRVRDDVVSVGVLLVAVRWRPCVSLATVVVRAVVAASC